MRMKSPPNQVYDECLEKDGDLLSEVVCSNLACFFCCIDEQLPTGIEQKWIPVVQSCEFKDTCDAIKFFGYLCCHHFFWIPILPSSFLDTCDAIKCFGYLVMPISAIGYLVGQFQLCWPISV